MSEDAPPAVEANRLREIERRRLSALVASDIELARSMHADDYELVTPGGARLTRDEYLSGVASGQLGYLVFEPEADIRVRLHGEAAILRYVARIEIQLPEEVDRGRFWHTDYYERRDGRWQAVWSHATRIKAG